PSHSTANQVLSPMQASHARCGRPAAKGAPSWLKRSEACMPAVLGEIQRSHCSGSGKASTGQVKPPRNASGIEVKSTTCKALSRSANHQPSRQAQPTTAGTKQASRAKAPRELPPCGKSCQMKIQPK